ncbi:MAG TPA: NAD(P)H-quinone oxidoreductase [Thermoanaerobaculia bacterium]|jgi:putative PIG3 family NAD(P)H quinone oxidoreductase|nr:NAD(P)H-quinone oxidoreductase [Thermoanaerobaculia bacterium]
MLALDFTPHPQHPELRLVEVPDPVPGPGEVLLRVCATALNRADLLQVRGLYPPPAGESAIPGLEASGVVTALGEGIAGWRPGDRAMALLAGGGHAEQVVAPVGQLMPLPEPLTFVAGAAIPEVGLTAWTNLVHEGALQVGEAVLITAAASGVGSFAVQLARELGGRPLVAGRDPRRLSSLRPLGAEAFLSLGPELPAQARAATGGAGVDLVLDLVGGEGLVHHLDALRDGGRLVQVGLLGGARATLDLSRFMRRRLRLIGSVLRARSRAEKAALVAAFTAFALPRLANGRLRPVVDRVLPFARIADAYAELEAGGVLGKIVLEL